MSQTRGYKTGGTIHIIVNNQVGFTTSRREDSRSTEYCTDVAKMVQSPIFHVNADDIEAVNFVTQLAMDYRYEFKKDIVLDLICYRRRGHNEADEPSATQPLMYAQIKQQKTTRARYAAQLVSEGVLSDVGVKQMEEAYRSALEAGEPVVKELVREPDRKLFVDWKPYLGHEWTADHDTSFPMKRLQELGQQINSVPTGFSMQKQVEKTYEDRRKMAAGALPCNWGFAETLAYATLWSRISVFALPARMWVVEHSPIAKRPCTIKKPVSPTRRFNISLKSNHVLSYSIRSYLKKPYLHLNMDTQLQSLVVWRFGKRNLVILPTERRL